MQSKLDLSYRGILRAAKRHNVKLTPGATVGDYRNGGCGCALTALAVDNNIDAVYMVRDGFGVDAAVKMYAIEAGFEDWRPDGSGYRLQLAKDNPAVYNRYEKIGRRLREYAGYDRRNRSPV
jgi:hypothetical protein